MGLVPEVEDASGGGEEDDERKDEDGEEAAAAAAEAAAPPLPRERRRERLPDLRRLRPDLRGSRVSESRRLLQRRDLFSGTRSLHHHNLTPLLKFLFSLR